MISTSPVRPALLPGALLLGAIFVIAISMGNDFQYRFLNADQQTYVDTTLGIDHAVQPLARQGNIFLYFNQPPGDRSYLTRRWYFRSVYDAYPNRVLVADPSTVINDDHDITHGNFNPDNAWLADHDISELLTFNPDLSGFNAQIIPARSK